ncbi:MAG: hypothetical protein M2R45_04348 [Verrucomicrobia subdivision 3 bacterium]|nr:hypothetical protein [Limisphaerales bacterium]MCS1416052.1 hypothetical protein [Limisphaerales bacterium]
MFTLALHHFLRFAEKIKGCLRPPAGYQIKRLLLEVVHVLHFISRIQIGMPLFHLFPQGMTRLNPVRGQTLGKLKELFPPWRRRDHIAYQHSHPKRGNYLRFLTIVFGSNGLIQVR